MSKSAHSRALERHIADHRQAMLEALALGQDPNSYWRIVGVIQGLGDALKFSEKVDFILSGGAEPDVDDP